MSIMEAGQRPLFPSHSKNLKYKNANKLGLKKARFGEIPPSNFQDITLTKPKGAFSRTLEPTITLNFDLLTPKVYALILVLKCTNVEFGENMSYTFQDIMLTTFRMHRRSDSWTHKLTENIVPLATVWQRHE